MKIIKLPSFKGSKANKKIMFNQPIKRFAVITLLLGILAFIPNALFAQSPTIVAFSPTSGAIGSSVIITGTGFNTTANQNIVFFGATQATVTAASISSLTVTVPIGATYQNISVTNLAVNLTAYSAQPFIVTLAGNIAFANKVDFTTGTQPYVVCIGDIDGDGKSDLAVTNYGNNSVSVFLNTSASGTVSFAAKVDFTTGTNPFSVSIGDIDGDGKPDLAVTNQGSNTISVFRNTSTLGFVNFATKVDFSTGPAPQSVNISDLDGDGKPDLAVTNGNSNTVSVFLNISTLGNVSFGAKVDFTTGANPAFVSIGDIDGDGKPDLAVANLNSNTVSVLCNTSTLGFINFATKVDFATGIKPNSVSIGDIDGDGKADLVVANQNSNTVSVFHNTSTLGTVNFAAKTDFTVGSAPLSVSITDIDGDGKPDLAVANANSNTVSVFRNTSISGFVSFTAKVDFATGIGPYSVSIGDIDGDGKPDLAVTNQTSKVSIIRQITPVTITSFSPMSGAIGSSVMISGTGFNATANQNIVFFGATQATVTAASTTSLTVTVPTGATYQNISVTNLAVNLTAYSSQPFIVTLSGNIAFADKVDFTTGAQPYLVSIGDIDGDGKPDLALANGSSNSISVLRNTSVAGTVSFATKADFATGSVPESASIGDIDGDGKPDLIVNNWNSNSVSILLNTSTPGVISFATKVDFGTGTNPGHSVSIGDIDGDGKPDLAVANWGSSSVSVFRNTSTLGFVSFAAKNDFTTGTQPACATIGDIDGDSKPDLTLVNHGNSNVSVFRNTSTSGAISFAARADFGTGTSPYSVSIGDIDSDGKLDLAVVNQNSNSVSVLRNTSILGTVNFAGKVDFTTGTQPLLVNIADIDGDGKVDLAVANNGGSNTVSIFDNTSSPGTINFSSKVDFTTGAGPYSVNIGDIDGDSKPDLVVTNQSVNSVSVIRQEDLPQGSLTANGPFCSSGIGQLTWTATAGTGLFTIVYNDGVAYYTVTSVSSGVPFNVFTNPVTSTTTYSLVSVSYPNNAIRTNGFTGPTATITINSAPTFTCPLNQTENTNAGLCTAAVSYSATSVTGPPAPTFTYSFSGATTGSGSGTGSGSIFNTGVTSVTLTATNACGTSTSSFSITVTDNINPTITAPANINATTNTGCIATGVSLGTPTTADNCSVAIVTNNAPAAFSLGNTIVTWTVTDGSGNTTTATQTVTVTDNINPTITAPVNISATTNTGCTATGVSLGTPTTSDNCSVASVINDSPAIFPLGNTVVTWTVTDGSANTTTATQTVTVTDNINPTIIAPVNINATTNAGCTATGVSIGTPITADNCSVASVINDSPAIFPLGNTVITWTVTDGSANTTTATQTVTVTDNINPTIIAPVNINATTNAGCTATGVSLGTPTTSDNCSVASVTNNAPVAFPLGNTIVTWTATDGSGNTTTATQTITVTDNINPTITAPVGVTFCNGTAITLGTLITTDNCSIANVTNDAPGIFPIGNTTVTWTVTDGSGNTATATQTIIVNPLPNVTTNLSGATITSNQNGATYQWLDCNNSNTPITGETNQSYTATVNGNYAVAVTLNGCSDTSACVNVNTVGIGIAIKSNNQLAVYPNPNNGVFTIQSTSEGIYSIINELGQKVQLIELNATNTYTVNIENLNNGIYFIVGFGNQITKQKVVVTK